MSHPQDLSLREQAAAIAGGELDPAELLAATLERIEERDPPLRSIVDVVASEAERMLASATQGPLYGVPVAVKDMFQLPWRGPREASPHEELPPGESGVYRRLRDSGAVVVGVTNMHMFGAGTTGHVSAYGPAGNPWEPEHCAGGSSTGSAAAVGARLVAGAVGTDGAGSIRLPAAYCGITGLKMTFAATPADGFTHGFSSMDVSGPMCRDAADCRLLGEAIGEERLPARDGAGLRVGIVREPFWQDLDPEAERACRAALEATGWRLEDVSLEGSEHALIASILRLVVEVLPQYRVEKLAEANPLSRALLKYQLLLPARLLPRADRVRSLLRRATAAALERVDLLAWPTVPAPAPPIANPTVELPSGPSPADPANVRMAGFANLTGVPAISVPVGLHSSGLPLGLQLHAAWGGEALLLAAAEHLERATDREHVDAVPPLAAAPAA